LGWWFRDGRILLSKAIQSASKIRKVFLMSSDIYIMPQIILWKPEAHSGGLGTTGVKPTYLITIKMEQILT
jgi:hypothetical protein